jgi:hypothetical protein
MVILATDGEITTGQELDPASCAINPAGTNDPDANTMKMKENLLAAYRTDALRQSTPYRGTPAKVYTIGLGNGWFDHDPVLLGRLASDGSNQSNNYVTNACWPQVLAPHGLFLQGPDDQAIENVFAAVARQVRRRLTN